MCEHAPSAAARFQTDLDTIGTAITALRTQETEAEADLEQKRVTWEAALEGLYAVLSK